MVDRRDGGHRIGIVFDIGQKFDLIKWAAVMRPIIKIEVMVFYVTMNYDQLLINPSQLSSSLY